MIGRPLATLILQEEAGKQFDPAVVTAFLRVEPLIQPLRLRLSPAP
jgi:response regulator RpfG family c-di-GMP phosphodiesterase